MLQVIAKIDIMNNTITHQHSPTLYFKVTTPHLRQDYMKKYQLLECSDSPDSPARITINNVPHRLTRNLIARYIKARMDLYNLNVHITSDGMSYEDLSATFTDPAVDIRNRYMVNYKTPAQIILQGSLHVVWALHSDICSFFTRQLHGYTSMFPDVNHFLLRNVIPIESHHEDL